MSRIFLLLAFPVNIFAQLVAVSPSGSNMITLICKNMVNCEQTQQLHVYEPLGLGYKIVQTATRNEEGNYVFQLPKSKPKFYAVGISEAASSFVILGEDEQVFFYGDCAKLDYSRAMGKINLAYYKLKKRIEQLTQTEQDLTAAWRAAVAAGNEANIKMARQQMQQHEQYEIQFIDSLSKTDPLLSKIAAILLPPNPFSVENQSIHSEFEYLATHYFDRAQLSDPIYNQIPDLIEAFDLYGRAIAATPAMSEKQKEWALKTLQHIPSAAPARRLALTGLIRGFQITNSPLYIEFAKMYVDAYRHQDYGEVKRIELELNKNRTFMPGSEVPDLVGATPDGGQFSLKQLRGKYVLIDFWASWCGPCRRENPNVKAAYEKYRDKGFDILGVSLDRTHEAWVGAIAADGLPWKHISDLKGWQSEHAQLYSVTSIPQTLLIDPQGKLIVRNLRGEQLFEKLEQLFGN